ncbi:hypothetical protein GBA52_015999 [Prunus armeniaca]|nr:hypothetical protein GBA52_015999 [Prunus armeniaca]
MSPMAMVVMVGDGSSRRRILFLQQLARTQMETFLRMSNLGLIRYDALHVGRVLGSSNLVAAKELHN